jgi:glycogenin glucosyltransferase
LTGSVDYFKRFFTFDADCLIKASPEDIFERNVDFAAAPDIFPPDKFNAGVLLIVRINL